MQDTPLNLLLDEQLILQQDSDTAHPKTPVPIFYIHAGDMPFCTNTSCFCQRGKRAGAMLYQDIAKGKLLLAQLAETESREEARSHTIGTTQPTRTGVTVPLVAGIPEECQLYGHSWQVTEHQDGKECSLCHIRGFCPDCVTLALQGAHPFYCTAHTSRRQVQQ